MGFELFIPLIIVTSIIAGQPYFNWIYRSLKNQKIQSIDKDEVIVSIIIIIGEVIAAFFNSWIIGSFFALTGTSYFSYKRRIERQKRKDLEIQSLTGKEREIELIKRKISEKRNSISTDNWN